jgi:hypothetical protein
MAKATRSRFYPRPGTERRIAFPVDKEKSEIRIRGFRHRNREKTP